MHIEHVHAAYNRGKKLLEQIGWVVNVIFKRWDFFYAISGKLGAENLFSYKKV